MPPSSINSSSIGRDSAGETMAEDLELSALQERRRRQRRAKEPFDDESMAGHLDDVPVLPQPMIELLPEGRITQALVDETSKCIICMEQFHTGEIFTSLPCTHRFHPTCIRTWLAKGRDACPVCMTTVKDKFPDMRPRQVPAGLASSRPASHAGSSSSHSSAHHQVDARHARRQEQRELQEFRLRLNCRPGARIISRMLANESK